MQFRRLFALTGLILCLAISLTLPATAQKKPGKDKNAGEFKSGKLTNAKLPKGKAVVAQQTFGITPNVTNCATKVPITPGQTINGALVSGDCQLQDGSRFDEYTFTASAGQTLSISMSSGEFDTYLILLNPDNTLGGEDDDGGGGTNSRIPTNSGSIAVQQTGTYSILANSFDPDTFGNYSVTLTFGGGGATCPPAATPISNGQTLNGTLVAEDCSLPDSSRYDLYSFSASAGQQVAITMTAAAPLDAYLILVGPDSVEIAENNDGGGGTNARIPPVSGAFGTLPATGTYTIYANSNLGNQFGSYSISLSFSGVTCPKTPIALGQTINGTLAAGDCRLPIDGSFLDQYSFNGTAGQQIAIGQASTALDSFLILLSPTGSAVAGDDDSGGGLNARIPGPTGAFTLPSTGEYVILANTIDTNGTGPYSITLSTASVAASVQLTFTGYAIGEGGGAVNVGVTRTGDLTLPAAVDYATSDPSGLNNCSFITGNASARCDYTAAVGTARFAIGESARNISIPIIDDSFAEGNENFTITLSNATGATLGSPNTATITIQDNEATDGANPIDGTAFFVRQQYLDFLNREPDPPGFAAWQAVINGCAPGDTTCDRIHVSSGFFRSPEFQDRGYFVYRFYPVAFGRKPVYTEFIPDLAKVSGFLSTAELEAAKVAFINEFMTRTEFTNKYNGTTNTQYVDLLLSTAGITHPARDFWIAALGNSTRTRAQVLREISETTEVYNKFFNQAFVVMQYFGYLRREPDAFYLQWIAHLDSTGDYRSMINGFMNSTEYRIRFGP
ncbi:MAG: pre-peptidase C-terminal domain-containing protein [Pyrinomonadaceae bacterium]